MKRPTRQMNQLMEYHCNQYTREASQRIAEKNSRTMLLIEPEICILYLKRDDYALDIVERVTGD